MAYSIEVPTDNHVEPIAGIWQAGWHEAHKEIVPQELTDLRTPQSFRDRARAHLQRTFIVQNGSAVLGFCMVKEDELYQLYVSGGARGTGAARMLLLDAEHRMSAAGYTHVWLACAVGNQRAAAFYAKCGWVNAGQHVVELDTQQGHFPLNVWRFEKRLSG